MNRIPACKKNRKYLVLDRGHYRIPLDDLRTMQGVVEWRTHLLSKTWFDPEAFDAAVYAVVAEDQR